MVTRITRTTTPFGLLALLSLGCSDGGDNGRPVTAREFVAASAVAQCDDFGACCAQDEHPFDERSCRARLRSVLQTLADSDATVYDADAAGMCLAAMHASPGQCQTTSDEFFTCRAVFRGTRSVGEPCAAPQECAGFASGDVFCAPPEEGGVEVCTAVQRPLAPVGEGAACGWTCDLAGGCTSLANGESATCLMADGLYCASATGTCTRLVAAGGSCAGETLACVAGTFCDGERCAALRQLGESCPTRAVCAEGAFCDDGTCTALRDEGESCALRYGGCDAQTCRSPDPSACRTGLLCSTRDGRPTCVAPRPNGAACTSFSECSSRWCELPSCAGDGCSAVGVCRDPKRTTAELCAGDFSEEDAQSVQSASSWMSIPSGPDRPAVVRENAR